MTCNDASTLSVEERWVTFKYEPEVTAVGESLKEVYVAEVEVEKAGKSPEERADSGVMYTPKVTVAITLLLAWHIRESVG
jgi:hypothetical protein